MSAIEELFAVCVRRHPSYEDDPLKALQETLDSVGKNLSEFTEIKELCFQFGPFTIYADRIEVDGKVVIKENGSGAP